LALQTETHAQESIMPSFCRFALHNYSGDPKAHYLVEKLELTDDDTHVAPEVTHLVLIVDRSGSMYYDMAAMRTMVEKLLTLEEYRDASMLATLISYSSMGDYTVHFSRKTVAEIMRPGSGEVEAIRQLRVTGLTCISQALEASKQFIEDGETTCIALHSDGYANDRSPTAERREIDRICTDLATLPGVFVNTIAYSNYSDFKLLVGIANAMSGKCVQAGTVKEVYDALHDTAALLAGRMAPAIRAELGSADYQVFVSRGAGRINGAGADMVLRGLAPEHDKTLYRFRQVDEQAYLDSDVPVAGNDSSLEPVYAFTAAKLSEGHLNTAKFAMVATRMSDLVQVHYRALTGPALAAMYEDLLTAVVRPDINFGPVMPQYGLGLNRIPLITLLGFLGQHARSLTVDMAHLKANYNRRGLKKDRGTRAEDGSLIPPAVGSRLVGDRATASVSSFDLNNNTASINMLCVRPIEIVKDKQVVTEVAGIRFEGENQLHAYNNYTIVGDGELNLDALKVKLGDKRVFRQLAKWGLLSLHVGSLRVVVKQGEYDPAAFYEIDLSELPLVDFQQPFSADSLQGVFNRLAHAKVVVSMMAALLKGRSDRFTDAQLAELGEYNLTGSLYYSPPTTVPYTDKAVAFAEGQIDSRVSYQIDIGSTSILLRGQLLSANACLQRFFVATKNGNALPKGEKVKMPMWWDDGVAWSHKTLSIRTKITPIDDLMKPLYDDFLGLDRTGVFASTLTTSGVDAADIIAFENELGDGLDPDDVVELFNRIKRQVHRYSEELFDANVRPLVFYMGATGLLPDELEAPARTADDMKAAYPALKIGKPQAEGTFFVLEGDVVISVFAKSVDFSIDEDRGEALAG
jgi:Mg-chelatase subunit ChlD